MSLLILILQPYQILRFRENHRYVLSLMQNKSSLSSRENSNDHRVQEKTTLQIHPCPLKCRITFSEPIEQDFCIFSKRYLV